MCQLRTVLKLLLSFEFPACWLKLCGVQVTGFQLDKETEADICSDDPWIILHKLDSPSKMRYIGARVAACPKKSGAEALVVPASIATWVAKIGALPVLLNEAPFESPVLVRLEVTGLFVLLFCPHHFPAATRVM